MVRKPENIVPTPLQQALNNPPYPLSPADYQGHAGYHAPELPESSHPDAHAAAGSTNTSPGFHEITHEDTRASNSDAGSINSDWDSGDDAEEEHTGAGDLPAPLKVGAATVQTEKDIPENKAKSTVLPEALRAGPSAGARPRPPIPAGIDQPRQATPLQSQNPYLNMQTSGQSIDGKSHGAEDSNAIWGGKEPQQPHVIAQQEPVELPSERTPVDELSKMSLRGDAVTKPDSPAADLPVESKPATERHGSDASSAWDPGMDLSSLDAYTSRGHGLPSPQEAEEEPKTLSWQDQQRLDRSERERRDLEAAAAQLRASKAERERLAEEEWHQGEQAARDAAQVSPEPKTVPDLPPRPCLEAENSPPRPRQSPGPYFVDAIAGARSGGQHAETQRRLEQKQECYSIKHIRWFDGKVNALREAPILTQNANGPCPLLALVNTLVLSTPASEQTALMETLRTREQVSLGLLLDAVFDELMSERRAGAAQELPDISELYEFLFTLHTGMNVNPRFTGESEHLIDAEPTDRHFLRHSDKAGGFEQTREMRLYSTFNIPLIHGWLPPSQSRAYAAFNRVAKTYEDAQNMQFHEEELEGKLSSQGLTVEEQKLYEDLQIIKAFFETWPTQLTEHGLGAISQSLSPASFAILFRNDHFSTIYKEPRSGKILTLVTDAGYSSHDEIVWESLVDINGKNSELYSGDFRPVSHSLEGGPQGLPEPPIRSLLDDSDQGWTTVNNRNNRRNFVREEEARLTSAGVTQPQETGIISTSTDPASSISPNTTRTEQEDADLALALQLQEEEEDRHRRDQEATRRRREDEASQSFIEHDQSPPIQPPRPGTNRTRVQNQQGPSIPPRRNNVQTHRPAASNDEAPPPTYEQAASGPAFRPPPGHPSSPMAPMRQESADPAQSGIMGGRRRTSQPTPLINRIPEGSGTGRGGGGGSGRRSSATGGPVQGKEDGKCVVM